jgi:hypothetical protein
MIVDLAKSLQCFRFADRFAGPGTWGGRIGRASHGLQMAWVQTSDTAIAVIPPLARWC